MTPSVSSVSMRLPAISLDDAQLHVLIEHQVPRLAQGLILVAPGVELSIHGELAQVITAMLDFELRALQRLRAQGFQPTSTPQQ